MFKQLRDWMICGVLNDKYDEFYIYLDKNHTNPDSTIQTTNQDDNLLMLDGTLAGFNLNNINEVEELFIGVRFNSSYSQYTLSSPRLPSYLNLKCANKILFTGELLQLFQAKFLNEINNDDTLDSTNQTNRTQFISEFDKSLNTEFNIMNEKLDVFSKEIYEVSKQEFSIINFETLITKIRNHVSEVSS